ncbi:AfsR/SARP family transcriptional regulator [Nocardiopsis metallicus]|uniref:DNA-binding SARP family transcriptional activator n=1 Tax=Nocardiopsis metallicus TaxID=179819 RepID=A0A840WPX3_9ACTN|nr:AfsR/SARP family transcriptional regulator [Nocardiopsis metallicus]MBB5492168.1 DNA-binding SARP family transcriptional activator [Nocardiopsis metallicus]
MRIGVLGPLRVVADGRETGIGGARLRVLLTRLALGVGGVVSPTALSEALWPEGGPAHPHTALHSLATRLRRTLPEPHALRSEPEGYRLALPPEAVDAARFERLAVQGRGALRDGHPEDAAQRLREALSLWRGAPLADTAHLPFAVPAVARLERIRLGVREDLVAAELGSSDATERKVHLAELEELIADHPLRERLRELLVAVLAADGRRGEALTAHEEYRRLLAAQLGTVPGKSMRALHQRLLGGRGDGPSPGP